MTLLGRSVVRATGFVGAPGYNIIHWSAGVGPGPSDPEGVEEWHDSLQTTLALYSGVLVNGVSMFIEADVVYFDDSDGVILGSTTDPIGDRGIACTGTGTDMSRATCLTVRHRTSDYVNGRRLQGRTFLGPVASQALDVYGQVNSTIIDDAADNWVGLISGLGGRLAVWHRPTTPTGTDGSYGDVTSISINSVPGTLRSRKT